MPRRKVASLVSVASRLRHVSLPSPISIEAGYKVHVFLPGDAMLLQSSVVRRTIRPALYSTWLPFLVGSGAGAVAGLGLAAYERSWCADARGPPTMQNMSMSRSFFQWPWRSASASGPSSIVLPQGHMPQSRLPGFSRPPLLPPPSRISDAAERSSQAPPPPPQQQPAVVNNGASKDSGSFPLTRQSISDAASKASPSVVHLVVTEDAGVAPSSFMGPARSTGSGILYHSDGFVLTNAHVVAAACGDGPGLPPLLVTTHDGCVFRGRVISMDRMSDLAVVKVDSPDPLPAAQFGSSSDLRLGAWVVALGSPLMLKHSVTAGIVSCVERRGAELGLTSSRTGYIQTDAAINQGSSGGPLCNLDGEVVGINNMKAVAADGVSFAIPADAVREIVRQFHLNGRVIRPYIGITMLEVANGGLKQLREQVPAIPALSQSAVVIQRVVDGSPAMEAGLRADDLLISVEGKQHLCMSRMIEEFASSIGKRIQVQVLRRGEDGEYHLVTRHLVPVEAPP